MKQFTLTELNKLCNKNKKLSLCVYYVPDNYETNTGLYGVIHSYINLFKMNDWCITVTDIKKAMSLSGLHHASESSIHKELQQLVDKGIAVQFSPDECVHKGIALKSHKSNVYVIVEDSKVYVGDLTCVQRDKILRCYDDRQKPVLYSSSTRLKPTIKSSAVKDEFIEDISSNDGNQIVMNFDQEKRKIPEISECSDWKDYRLRKSTEGHLPPIEGLFLNLLKHLDKDERKVLIEFACYNLNAYNIVINRTTVLEFFKFYNFTDPNGTPISGTFIDIYLEDLYSSCTLEDLFDCPDDDDNYYVTKYDQSVSGIADISQSTNLGLQWKNNFDPKTVSSIENIVDSCLSDSEEAVSLTEQTSKFDQLRKFNQLRTSIISIRKELYNMNSSLLANIKRLDELERFIAELNSDHAQH